jgi:hypothetical protein
VSAQESKVLNIMYIFPSICQAKTRAKHLSRTFNIKLTDAQEIVAYMFKCNDWAELIKKKSDPVIFDSKYDVNSDYLTTNDELQQFDALVSPHIEIIKRMLTKGTLSPGGLLERITSKSYNKISARIIRSVISDCEEFKLKGSEFIDTLQSYDDTFNQVLYRARRNHRATINTHIEAEFYRHKFYAYYTFNRNELYVLSREWDLDICRPSNTAHKTLDEKSKSVCSRKWFVDYMIGYLKLLTQQFRMAGYSGIIRICTIKNVSVHSFYARNSDECINGGITRLFEALLDLGGEYAWEEEDGRKCNLGIEIPFSKKSVEWIIGDTSL